MNQTLAGERTVQSSTRNRVGSPVEPEVFQTCTSSTAPVSVLLPMAVDPPVPVAVAVYVAIVALAVRAPFKGDDYFCRQVNTAVQNVEQAYLEAIGPAIAMQKSAAMLGDGTVTQSNTFDPQNVQMFYQRLANSLQGWMFSGLLKSATEDLHRLYCQFTKEIGRHYVSGYFGIQFHVLPYYRVDKRVIEVRDGQILRDHPVDLVHLHVPQGFGGGLLRVASEAGARVVVTMHDWWWFCARQFLMDKSGRRCSPVVDAGTCECEVSRLWLAARRAWLDGQLRYADAVIAPSATAAASRATP